MGSSEAYANEGCRCGGPVAGDGGELIVSLEEALIDCERIPITMLMKAPSQLMYKVSTLA